MIEEVKLPEISENVETGEVTEVLVKVGDFVKTDDSLVELETEKAAFEVPSPVTGRVVEINLEAGQTVTVGQVLVRIDTAASEDEPHEPPPAPEPKVAEPPQPPKPTVPEPPAPKPAGSEPPQTHRSQKVPPVSPSVRQLARELGVDLAEVRGSGLAGRVSAADVRNHAKTASAPAPAAEPGPDAPPPAAAGVVPALPLPDFSKWGPIERKPMSVTRKKIAQTLSYAWTTIPHVTQSDEADITDLEKFRREYGPTVQEAGGKLTVTAIVLKVVASAMKEFPEFNASVDMVGHEVIYKKYCHISVAVDTDRGLLVPVIRDVDTKSLKDLSIELTQLAERARTNKITPDDMVGGCFTISNLGGIGGTYFSPIVYWPQTAILGIARAVKKPVYVGEQLQPRLMLPLSLSYDHRIIDGAGGLRFLRRIIEMLQSPFLLALRE